MSSATIAPRHRRALALLAATLPTALAANAANAVGDLFTPTALYDFAFKPDATGLAGSVSNSLTTSGTLIGNYDEIDNPSGTRTKAGINIFAPFPATLNEAVDTNLGVSLSGDINTETTGGFSLAVNTTTNTAELSGFSADFLSSGPASLGFTIDIGTPTGFQTRNPTFLYPPGSISLPVGSADLTQLTATQAGIGAAALIPTATPNQFTFTAAVLVDLMATVEVLGQSFEAPAGQAVPIPIAGTLTLDGMTASLNSLELAEFDQSIPLDIALPQIPLPLPTLNPATPANVLLDLSLADASFAFDGQFALNANGVLVPAPGAASFIALGLFAAARRRR